MRSLFQTSAIVLITAILLGSCKTGTEEAQMIPANALIAGYFNTESILQKLPPEEIETSEMFPSEFALPGIQEILRDPEKTGIDTKKGLIAFAAKDEKKNPFIVLAGSIKNETAFETFNKQHSSSGTTEKAGDIRRLQLDENVLLGWNRRHFYYVINPETPELSDWDFQDSNTVTKPTTTDVNQYLDGLLKQSKKESLASDNRFNDLMKETGDLKIWINSEQIMDRLPTDMLAMLRTGVLLKESRTSYVIRFEDGHISASQKAYYGKELEKVVKNLAGSNISSEEFSHIPSDDINGVVAIHLKPEGIKELLQLVGADGLANIALSRLDVNLDQLLQSIDGKFLFSVSDLNMGSGDTSESVPPPVDFNFLFKTGIRNQQSFQKVWDGAARMGLTSGMAFSITDNMFITGNREEFISKYRENTNRKAPAWAEKISGHPFGMYIDLQRTGSAFPEAKDSMLQNVSALSKSFWKDVYGWGGEPKGNSINFTYRIDLMKEDENSLRQLNRYVGELRRLQKEGIQPPARPDTLSADPLTVSP